jgi:hypothetical protein
MRPFGNETGCAILSAFRGRTGGGIFYACKNIYIDHPAPTISNRRICNGAPSIVRAPSLMIVLAVQQNHYGFIDRLWIDHLYRSGELTGVAPARAIEQGLLDHQLKAGPFVQHSGWL